MKRIAVVLAGCGAKDGSEIHEATLALYALAANHAEYRIFAPDTIQHDVVNHITDEALNEQRNVLVEAARIARGDIEVLEALDADDFDGLLLPGGFGAAKNLFTFAFDGIDFKVLPRLEQIVRKFHARKKPIAAMCIAPVMLAKVLGEYGVEITIGPQGALAASIEEKFGAKVSETDREGVVKDEKNKVVTTPAYMYGDSSIAHIGRGADRLVKALLGMTE